MAAIIESSSSNSSAIASNQSQSQSVESSSGGPQFRYPPEKTISPPWNQVVRGESEMIAVLPTAETETEASAAAAAASSSASSSSSSGEEGGSEGGPGPNGYVGKRQPWKKPSNGPGPEVVGGSVMGADSWPALTNSKSTRTTPVKSSSETVKSSSSDVPAVLSQEVGGGTTLSSNKQINIGANPNSTANHSMHSRRGPMKRNGGYASPSPNGGVSHSPRLHNLPVDSQTNSQSPRSHVPKSGLVENHNGNENQHQQRTSFRNRNGGTYPRGDGSHSHGHGFRHDQDRFNPDWVSRKNFHPSRDAHPSQPRRYIRPPQQAPPPPPVSSAYITPPPPRFGAPMGFPEYAPPVYYVPVPPEYGMPFVPPPAVVYYPPPDPLLHSRIVNQVDYYFSNDNLVKDTFLRKQMDDQGWVHIALIAQFNKISVLTDNVLLIVDALRNSAVVEVQGDKVRKRNDWYKWVMPASVQLPDVSGLRSPGSSKGSPGSSK